MRRLAAFALGILLAACGLGQSVEEVHELLPPGLQVELSTRGERLAIKVSNTDAQSAACFLPPATGDAMWADHTAAYFRVFDASGREVDHVGEVFTGSGPALRTQVVFIRPRASLTSAVSIEEQFPGALAPGSCIAFHIPFYANCRAVERWDITAPMRPDADQPGAGNIRSDWRVSDTGELSRLPNGQQCTASSQ